jgi:hypothetical protein
MPTRRTALKAAAALLAALGAGTAAWVAPAGARPAPAATPAADLAATTLAACGSIPSTADPAVTLAVYGVGRELGVSSKVMLAGFETGWVESHMRNLDCGDRDSIGVFQQRPSQGWGTRAQIMNPRYAARQFFVRAIAAEARCPSCSAGRIAQSVQVSAFPDRYDRAAGTAGTLRSNAASRYAGRYSIRDVCGAGFRYIDARELSRGTVYLLWNGTSNCVTTIKHSSIGTPSAVRAYLDPAGGAFKADSGSYRYFAGPVTLRAPGCIRWGGTAGTNFASGSGHCG